MMKLVSLATRRELLASSKEKYRHANWTGKKKILDALVATTGYDRKYVIRLLNGAETAAKPRNRLSSRKYDEQVR